jgi:hypothetical protein
VLVSYSCLKAIKTYFPIVQVVKGRPRAPHVQGIIERGNAPFKQALQDCIQVNNTDSWHVVRYIANQQMINCPHEGRDMLTLYQINYSREDERTFEDILGCMAHSYRSGVASCRGSDGKPQVISF